MPPHGKDRSISEAFGHDPRLGREALPIGPYCEDQFFEQQGSIGSVMISIEVRPKIARPKIENQRLLGFASRILRTASTSSTKRTPA